MNDNHNHADDVLVNALVGTVPQARPEFQQALEDQMMLALQERSHGMEMKRMSSDDRDDKPKRLPRGLPVTLAATFAMILFGGLAALIATGPLANAPIFSGAAQQQQDEIPDNFASTATALIAQATYEVAQNQFLTANAQLQALDQQATERAAAVNPDQPMTSVVQSATAVVQQATQRAGGDLFLTAPPPSHHTATAMILRASEEASLFWTSTAQAFVPTFVPTATPIATLSADAIAQTCPPEKLVIYTAPGTHNPVLGSINPLEAEKYQVQGILTLQETGEDWFFVSFAYEGEETQGWVQADTIRAACEPLTASVISGDTVITMLPPTIVPPPASSGPLFSPVCAPDSIAYYVDPGEDTAVAGRVNRGDMIGYQVEASVMINNIAEQWLLVRFDLDSAETARGWVRALELSPACHPTVVPGAGVIVEPLLVTPTPTAWDMLPMLTATPIPLFTVTPAPIDLSSNGGLFTPTLIPPQSSLNTVQVRVGNAENLDLEALAGQRVDIYIAVGSEDEPVIVPVARAVTVYAFVEVPIPNEDRYTYIDAIIIPNTAEQAELLHGFAQIEMHMKLVPVE